MSYTGVFMARPIISKTLKTDTILLIAVRRLFIMFILGTGLTRLIVMEF